MMKLYLVRHTETNYNILNLSNSDPKINVHLTERGLKQAELLASKLKDVAFDIIITSKLPRTTQTANIINTERDIPLISDGRLNDINMGYEGESVAHYHAALAKAANIWTAKFNNGESLDDVQSRIDDFLRSLKSSHYNSALVVSHLSPLQLMRGRLENVSKSEVLRLDIPQGDFISVTF